MATLNAYLRKRGLNPDGSPIDPSKPKVPITKAEKAGVGEQRNQLPVEQSPKANVGASPTPGIESPYKQEVKLVQEGGLTYRKVSGNQIASWKPDFLNQPDKLRQSYIERNSKRLLFGQHWAAGYLTHRFTYKPADFHSDIWKHLCFDDRFCLAAFRGSGKSEVFRHYVLFTLLNLIWRDIVIISKTASLAISEWSTKINSELFHNQLINKHYGHLIHPMQKNAEDEKILACGSKISFHGKDYQIRGFRHDLVGMDDPETFQDVQSENARTMLEGFFLQDASNALALGRNQIVVLGNIFDRLCLVNKMVAKSEGKFQDYVTYAPPAEYRDENGDRKSIWPSAWPTEKLDAKRREIGSRAYQCEYMNNPVSADYTLVQDWHIKYADKLPVESRFDRYIVVDPAGFSEAGTNRNRDYSSVGVLFRKLGKDKSEDEFYWQLLHRFRKSTPAVAEFIFNLYLSYRPCHIVCEEHGIITIGDEIRRHFEDKGLINMGVVKRVKHSRATGDLRMRMEKHIGSFEQGKIFFKTPHKPLIEEELLTFPYGHHDDTVSVIEMGLTYAKANRVPFDRHKVKNPLFETHGTRRALIPDRITGVPR